MDDYLDDEMDEFKRAFEVSCKDWERSISLMTSSTVRVHWHIYPSHPSLMACTRSRSMGHSLRLHNPRAFLARKIQR